MGTKNEEQLEEVVEVNDEVIEEPESSVEESKASVEEEGERTFTAKEVEELITKAVTKRLSRVKELAIEEKVAEKTKTAEERVIALESELASIKNDKQVLELSASTGVDAELLRSSKLTGEALEGFAKKLEKANKDLLNSSGVKLDAAAGKINNSNSGKSVAELVAERKRNRKGA